MGDFDCFLYLYKCGGVIISLSLQTKSSIIA